MTIRTTDYKGVETVVGVGSTLKVYYDNSVRIMSDVWGSGEFATYWDGAALKTVCLWTSEYGKPQDAGTADVDATPEVKKEVYEFFYAGALADAISTAEVTAKQIEKGALVQVVGGKNANDKGKVGKVIFSKIMQYGQGYHSSNRPKLCIALDDVTTPVEKYGRIYQQHVNVIWVWEHNCERLDIAEINIKHCEQIAANAAKVKCKNNGFEYEVG